MTAGAVAATSGAEGVDKGAETKSSAAVVRAQEAAHAAEVSAKAAAQLRKELEDILRAVEVPMTAMAAVGADGQIGELLANIDDMDKEDEEEARKHEAQSTAEYVERQIEMENRLQHLQDQLDSASIVQPDSEIVQSMKGVIREVKRCLQRSELLFQLPEIKLFVKRFRRSLELNAIMHERWLGPEAVQKPSTADESESRPETAMVENKGLMQSRSTPEIRSKTPKTPGKRIEKGDGKKKPFRTVVDWCRPHTPLKADPQSRGALPTSGDATQATSPTLPPIV
jgi:hypothetical protein